MDVVVFRKGIVGAFVLVMHLDGETPAIAASDVARNLNAKIE
jgi:hypothetical protein